MKKVVCAACGKEYDCVEFIKLKTLGVLKNNKGSIIKKWCPCNHILQWFVERNKKYKIT